MCFIFQRFFFCLVPIKERSRQRQWAQDEALWNIQYVLNSFRLEVWGDKMKSEHKQAAVYANIWVTTSKHADRFYPI